MKIDISENDIRFLIESFEKPDENERDYSRERLKECIENNEFSRDEISDLISYLDDLFLLHGLKNDEPTEYGREAERLRDLIFYQFN